MDQTEPKSRSTSMAKLKSSNNLKMITKLLFSVSLFSLFFAQFSWLSFPHSLYSYSSKLPAHLFSHAIHKNCMFLLCNALMVFLVKYSGLTTTSLSGPSQNSDPFNAYEDGSIMPDPKSPLLELEIMAHGTRAPTDVTVEYGIGTECQIEEVIGETEDSVLEEEQEGRESQLTPTEEESTRIIVAEDEDTRLVNEEKVAADEEMVGEDTNGMLSTEELNRKFDEFISRMKEEIRIEAQQQLVMVK